MVSNGAVIYRGLTTVKGDAKVDRAGPWTDSQAHPNCTSHFGFGLVVRQCRIDG